MESEARAQPYMDKVPELRKKFLDKHYCKLDDVCCMYKLNLLLSITPASQKRRFDSCPGPIVDSFFTTAPGLILSFV